MPRYLAKKLQLGLDASTASYLEVMADTGAGVVVAGAYGRSRFREWVLGGVTQHLVGQTARCALLSR